MNRGGIRWYTYRPPDERRPVLLLTRTEVIEQLNEIIVVPAFGAGFKLIHFRRFERSIR
jgi:hypothetical protein